MRASATNFVQKPATSLLSSGFRFDTPSEPFIVDVQAGILSDLATRVVLPLVPQSSTPQEELTRLKPVLRTAKKNHILMTTDIGTVKRADLGARVANLEDQKPQITEAIDFLIQGF